MPEMSLPTFADIPLQSPISHDLGESEQTINGDLVLADMRGVGLQHVRGAEAAVRAVYGSMPSEIGEVLRVEDGLVARLTHDQWMQITANYADALNLANSSSLVTVTDVSHGYGTLLLAGPRSHLVLAKLCALDFSSSGFPDLRAAQTSLANVRALVLRCDQLGRRAYLIAVSRSLTAYIWNVLMDAAEEFEPALVDGASLIRAFIEGTAD